MANQYNRLNNADSSTRFSQTAVGPVERSRMTVVPTCLTTCNAGDIIPVLCFEVLPNSTYKIDMSAVVRETTLKVPVMGNLMVDYYAFFVPNRVVNHSWKSVMGENVNGTWAAQNVSLATICGPGDNRATVQIPVGSIADYYGFPTQDPFPVSVLKQCHDLKFRGYIDIYNEYFRDQNYQPPIPYSKLNVYEGFFTDTRSSNFSVLNGAFGTSPSSLSLSTPVSAPQDNTVGVGAVKQSIFGNLDTGDSYPSSPAISSVHASSIFNALGKPLKANKLHDYFTSSLPSPQRAAMQVMSPVTGEISNQIPVSTSDVFSDFGNQPSLLWADRLSGDIGTGNNGNPIAYSPSRGTVADNRSGVFNTFSMPQIVPANLATAVGAQVDGLALSINDLRMSAAIQQIYELLGMAGGRYRSYIKSFFGLEVDDPFKDIPEYLGHFRRDLDVFQTAQTSQSTTGQDGSPQGSLAAFSYTSTSGNDIVNNTFLEHGYVHILGVIRQKNVYPSLLTPDNFRLSMLDYYVPSLANISNQPIYTREINPFYSDPAQVFGYKEAWAEYRYFPDRVSGLMRPGVEGSLAQWNYADEFDASLAIADGEWLKSNAQAVADRSLATTTASGQPQFLMQIVFNIDMELPMPVYSVPGLDII